MTTNPIITQAALQLAKRTGETLQSAATTIERAAQAAGVNTERLDALSHFVLRTFGVADYTTAGADFSSATPAIATRGTELLALHKTGHGVPFEMLQSTGGRADFAALANAIATERGISFDAAVTAIATEAPRLDFSGETWNQITGSMGRSSTTQFDTGTQAGRDALYAEIQKRMKQNGTSFDDEYDAIITEYARESEAY